jgi:hypothetical protein
MAERTAAPADRCPYRGPFPRDFTGCPTFRPVVFPVADSMENPLGTVVTCAHLTSGERRSNHFYPRCAIGSSVDRLEWLGRIGSARLAALRELSDAFEALTACYRDPLLEAKSQAFAGPGRAAARRRLERLLDRFLERADALLASQAEPLGAAGLRLEQVRLLLRRWCTAWMNAPGLTPPTVDETLFTGMDRDLVDLIAPAALHGPAARADLAPDRDGRLGVAPLNGS